MALPCFRGVIAVAIGWWPVVVSAQPAPPAHDVSIEATVDKTTVDLGRPLTLTVTVTGDLGQLAAPPDVNLPDAFTVVASSQSTNVSVRGRHVARQLSLTYILVSTQPGTFQLGPFRLEHRGQPLLTEPIEVTVHKPVLPPELTQQDRILL